MLLGLQAYGDNREEYPNMNIFPSYKCNFNCSFCSFKNRPGNTIDLDWLEQQLQLHPDLCSDINILGGEPSVLPAEYQKRLIDICTVAAKEKPFFITNLNIISPYLQDTKPIVSYDFNLRQNSNRILSNILSLDMKFSMSTIMTSNLISNIGAERMLSLVDHLSNCDRIDLLLYRQADTAIDYSPNHDELMNFVAAVIDHPKVNLTPYSSMAGYTDNSFNNIAGRIGFLPDNKYGVRIDYKNLGYTAFDTYEEAISYYKMRTKEIEKTKPCSSCEFVGRCWCVGGYEDGVCHGDKTMMDYFKVKLLS